MQADGFRLRLQGDLANKIKVEGLKEYLFGIRPENLHDAEFYAKADSGVFFSGQVEVVEPMGAETYVHLTAGRDRFVARVTPKTGARVGQPLQLAIETAKIHVFDKKTWVALR
jgi:multiple sugar transport system ATP-binding protein